MTELASRYTAAMLWLTNSTVRPPLADVVHLAEALLLEPRVADREHFVDDQDLRLEVRRDREREPHVHAARVVLHRRVDEALDLGEGDDLVELARDLRAAHAENRAVQENVLAAGQLRMKPGADFEQRADAPDECAHGRASGSVIRDRIFSSVDLPAPLRPMMPDDVARARSRTTRRRAPRARRRPGARRPPAERRAQHAA